MLFLNEGGGDLAHSFLLHCWSPIPALHMSLAHTSLVLSVAYSKHHVILVQYALRYAPASSTIMSPFSPT